MFWWTGSAYVDFQIHSMPKTVKTGQELAIQGNNLFTSGNYKLKLLVVEKALI